MAVAPLDPILKESLKKHTFGELGVLNAKQLSALKDEWRRITDGQHKSLFFLPNPKIGQIDFPLIVKLDVGISLRYDEHVHFAKSKLGLRLCDIRSAKLAESYGNNFNRIALDDISNILDEHEYGNFIDKILGRGAVTISDANYDASHSELSKLKKAKSQALDERIKLAYKEIEKNKDANKTKAELTLLENLTKVLKKHKLN